MFKAAIIAAVFASVALAAGCGDDSSMMMTDADGGTIIPPTPVPPTPVPPPPVPPPPMDGGPGEICGPTADDPLATRCEVCTCDNSGIADFLASNPGIASAVETMSRCEPGSMNRCGFAAINLPPEMMTYGPFACAEFVNNDLWLHEGSPYTSHGSTVYPGGNGQFLADFNWASEGVPVYLCSDHECFSAWGVSTMPGYTGLHVRQIFSEDCQFVTTEYFGDGAPTDTGEFAHVEDCGDGFGDCI